MYRIALWGLAVALLNGTASASVVYSNTTTDLLTTLAYTANGFTQIGDQIHLGGTDRIATQATVQFYNNGDEGTFDATLRLFEVGPNSGTPVGAQIGSDVTLSSLIAPATNGLTGFNVTFQLGGVLVSDDLIFTVEIANQGPGVEIIGLDNYGPSPSVGASDSTFAIARNGSGFLQVGLTDENLFFELQAQAVPEPSTFVLTAVALFGLAPVIRRMRAASRRA